MRHALARWDALTRYLDDGRLEIDNNAAERAPRSVVLLLPVFRRTFQLSLKSAGRPPSRVVASVPTPPAVRATIRARSRCFWCRLLPGTSLGHARVITNKSANFAPRATRSRRRQLAGCGNKAMGRLVSVF